MKKILILLFIIMSCLFVSSCSSHKEDKEQTYQFDDGDGYIEFIDIE